MRVRGSKSFGRTFIKPCQVSLIDQFIIIPAENKHELVDVTDRKQAVKEVREMNGEDEDNKQGENEEGDLQSSWHQNMFTKTM